MPEPDNPLNAMELSRKTMVRRTAGLSADRSQLFYILNPAGLDAGMSLLGMARTLAPRWGSEKVGKTAEKDKRREIFAAFAWPSLPAAYEVSCRIRAGSPTSFWLDSPRTVASRR